MGVTASWIVPAYCANREATPCDWCGGSVDQTGEIHFFGPIFQTRHWGDHTYRREAYCSACVPRHRAMETLAE